MAESTGSPEFTREFKDVLQAEETYIVQRRKDIELKEAERKAFVEKVAGRENSAAKKKWEFGGGAIGLAFSGGGIRSATFNLGVLQAFARERVLRFCDYLSTVSGGGYIGSCFTSLLDNPDASVELDKFPFRFLREKKPDERKEVKWLRAHSNYLVLNRSFFGLDLWRFIGLYLSGLVLTNITTVALTIFLTYFLHLIVQRVAAPVELAVLLFQLSLAVFAAMVLARLGAALRNLSFKARRMRGYVQGFLARTAAALAVFGGLILLAVYLPKLERTASAWVQNLLSGGAAGMGGGLLMGLLKSENETLEKIRKAIFRVAWVALLPILVAWFVRFLWMTNVFQPGILFVPNIVLFAVGLFIVSLFANTNRISMHHFYRDRLSEAYIIKRFGKGADDRIASNEPLRLCDLHNRANGAPFQLVNTTLNVPSSTNRYLRGRGADFFLFSKGYCGAESTGYRKTERYNDGETRLATAMAISGAAASPQMGELSSPIMTFILTLLNVRLNRWMPNPDPARNAWIKFWPFYFVKELLDKGREDDFLLNLSDGGHHENLGVYELIKRRCEVIIASDAAADPGFNFGDIANLMRKVRIDLGVEIDIDLKQLRQNEHQNTKAHHAIGTIEYPDGKEGILVYIKTSLTGDEPEDLLAYRRKHKTFPDESTADQFFNEPQFESYRELGYIVGRRVFS